MRRAKQLLSDSCCRGFTLVELLVALSVSSIILTAVATLAYAMSSANDSTDDMSRKQAEVRYATQRVSELVRYCRLVCFAGPEDFTIWRGDDNGNGQINSSELVCIEKGAGGDHLQLCDFPVVGSDPVIALGDIRAYSTSWWESFNLSIRRTTLIEQCSDMEFGFDVLPPNTRFLSASFDLLEDGISKQCQINAYIRCWAGNLLNDAGTGLVSDDD